MSSKLIDAFANHPLAGERHFTPGELRDTFAGGFGDADRQRALVHFGQLRCQVCWNRLEELAASETPAPRAEGSPDDTFDPVLAVLRRFVGARRDPAASDQLRPAHRALLGHSQPQGPDFFRGILEESRQRALERSAEGLATAQSTRDLFERLPFEDLGPRWTDLKALAVAYVGDEYRAVGQYKPAARWLAEARQGLRRGTGDPELRATWMELQAWLDQAGGKYVPALRRLTLALQLLRQVKIVGRSAETLFLLGFVRLRSGDDRGAGGAFRQALLTMVPGTTLRLRLRTFLFLALAEIQSRQFSRAREHLAAARELEDGYGTQLLQAQRLFIEGSLHLESRSYGQAEDPLRQSLQRFLLLERNIDAAQVLVSLGRLYALTRRTREFDGLEQEFHSLLQASTTRKLILDLRERLVLWAQHAGYSLPSREELSAKLAQDRKKWIH